MNRALFHLQSAAGRVLPLLGRSVSVRGEAEHHRLSFSSDDELIEYHFARRSSLTDRCYASMREAIRLLGQAPSVIVETGMSAWGTNSSLLFDDYVSAYGGEFSTVDIRLPPLLRMRRLVGAQTQLTCDDSVRFLRRWVRLNRGRRADLVYLDSYDLNPKAPYPAALHGLREYLAIRPALGRGSLLLIDDTPVDLDVCPPEWRQDAESFRVREGVMPGKGMLLVPYLDATRTATKIQHGYQVLYRFDA